MRFRTVEGSEGVMGGAGGTKTDLGERWVVDCECSEGRGSEESDDGKECGVHFAGSFCGVGGGREEEGDEGEKRMTGRNLCRSHHFLSTLARHARRQNTAKHPPACQPTVLGHHFLSNSSSAPCVHKYRLQIIHEHYTPLQFGLRLSFEAREHCPLRDSEGASALWSERFHGHDDRAK